MKGAAIPETPADVVGHFKKTKESLAYSSSVVSDDPPLNLISLPPEI